MVKKKMPGALILPLMGRFRTTRTAPIITLQALDEKKNPGEPAGAVGCRIQDPGTRGYRSWKTADFSHSVRCATTMVGLFLTNGLGATSRVIWFILLLSLLLQPRKGLAKRLGGSRGPLARLQLR